MGDIRIAFYVSRFKDEQIQTPPSLQYLAGYLIFNQIVDKSNVLYASSLEEIENFEPDILCIGSVSQTFFDARNVAEKIKLKFEKCFIILGGYHISALPNELSNQFDIGVIGEGEQTLLELCKAYLDNSHKNIDVLKNIDGVCFYYDGELIKTNSRKLLKDIDNQPRPYRKIVDGQTDMYLFSARGCPYCCIYCASQSFWEKYRAYSAEYVVEEIEKIYYEFGITHIRFVDDLFIAPKKRLIEIYELLKERKLIGVLTFTGFIRINIVDEEVIKILDEMKFEFVRFGLETASYRLAKIIKHKPPKMEQIDEVIRLCKKYNLKVQGSLMFGVPGETKEDIEITVEFLRKYINDFDISGFYLIQPIPGTKLWDDMVEQNILTNQNFDVAAIQIDLYNKNFNWNGSLYLNEEKLPLEEFKEIIQEVRDEFILFDSNSFPMEDKIFEDIGADERILIFGNGTISKKLTEFNRLEDFEICDSKTIKDFKLNEFDSIFITTQSHSRIIYKKYFRNSNKKIYIPKIKYLNNNRVYDWEQVNC